MSDLAIEEGQVPLKTTFPRLANIYLRGAVNDAEVPMLAKWPVLVLATSEQVISQIPNIRAANPDIVILAYIGGSYTIGNLPDIRDGNVWFWQGIRDWANENHGWLLRADYSHAWSWLPNYWLLNPTAGYQDWLPGYVKQTLFDERPGIFDGLLVDNAWNRVSFANSGSSSLISLGSDGTPTPQAVLDAAWYSGMNTMYEGLRTLLGAECILVGNGPNSYPVFNGAEIEDFPRNFSGVDTPLLWKNWTLLGYPYSLARNEQFYAAPRLNIVNAGYPLRDGSAEYWRRLRFTLGSCLMFDSFFSFDASPSTHAQIWWEPTLYEINFGKAQAQMHALTGHFTGAFARDFEGGTVIVNPTGNKIMNVLPMDARIG